MPLAPFLTIEIRRVNGGVVEVVDAAAMAEIFFATEISSLGDASYDARTLTTHPNQVNREDIRVLNASFRARMETQLWEPLFDAGDLRGLSRSAATGTWSLCRPPSRVRHQPVARAHP